MDDTGMLPLHVHKLEKELRLGFIRKVLGILTAQLLFTTLLVLIVYVSPGFQQFLNANIWILYLCLGFYIVCSCMLLCCKKPARKVPINYIFLSIVTLSLGLITATITSQYDPYSVLMAVILTVTVTIALALYAYFTKTDFTACYGVMFVVSMCTTVVLIMILCSDNGSSLIYFYYWLCVIVYGIYLIIDIQLIVGKGRYKLSHEDYIVGALMLYIDIIMLFLELLRIFGSKH
jgi:FtsH-binding integral membrane protein